MINLNNLRMERSNLKNWVVKNDGSEKFINTVIKYLRNDMETYMEGSANGCYYGVDSDGNGIARTNIPQNYVCLTIDEFKEQILNSNFIKHNFESLVAKCRYFDRYLLKDKNDNEYYINFVNKESVIVSREVTFDQLFEEYTNDGFPVGIRVGYNLTFNDICQDTESKYFSEFLNEEIHWTGKNTLMSKNLESVKISIDFINSKFRKL